MLPVNQPSAAQPILRPVVTPIEVSPQCIRKIVCDAASFRKNQIEISNAPPESVEKALSMLELSKKYAHNKDESNASFFSDAAHKILSQPKHSNDPAAILQLGRLERSKNEHYTANLFFSALAHRFEDPQGHYELSCAYRDGLGVAKNEEKSLEYLKMAAEQGSAPAQYAWGMRYRQKEDASPLDQLRAFLWLKPASDQHHAPATFELGHMSIEGFGLAQNNAKGLKLIETAANEGLLEAQYSLGLMHSKHKQIETALTYFLQAAKQGHLGACCEAGIYYLKEGAEKGDLRRSLHGLKFITQAANGMVPWAQYKMGMFYKNGLQMGDHDTYIIHRDLDEAMVWLQKASEAEYAPAIPQLTEARSLKAAEQNSKERIEKLKRKAAAEITQTSATAKPNMSNKRRRIIPISTSSLPSFAHTRQDANNIKLNFQTPSKLLHSQAKQSPVDEYEESFPEGFDMNKHPSEFWK